MAWIDGRAGACTVAMMGGRMARGRRVREMQVSWSERAVMAGVDRRAGRRADDGHEGPRVTRGCRVDEEACRLRRCRNRGARGSTAAAGDSNRSSIDRKTKKNTPIKATDEREKIRSKGSGKRLPRAAGQHHRRMNPRYGQRSPRGSHGGRSPGGGARVEASGGG